MEEQGESMKNASVELARFEPTVFGAVRRYRIMVLAFALAGMVAAVGYTLFVGKTYQAKGDITVSVPGSQQDQDPAQYLDSQVLLLESPTVAQKAASIADATLHGNILSARDFSTSGGNLSITPPVGAAADTYGASIIGVTFASLSPKVAQTGASALFQAFDDVRSAIMAAQFKTVIAGIDNAISRTTNSTQRAALLVQRAQQLVDEQIDLAQYPATALAAEPTKPVGGSWKQAAAIGLVMGLALSAALAYMRASRRRGFIDRQDPAALYGVPLIGEIPVFEAQKALRSNGAARRGLPMSADPHSAVAEAFRFAAGSLERIRAERGPRLSLVFVSPTSNAGKSMVVANLALAIAEGGTRVLAVDADADHGDLTARLLPSTVAGEGLEEVLAGQQPLASCIQLSPLNGAVAVLGPGPAPQRRVTGTARAKAASAMLDMAKSSFDVVLIDSPGLLQVADASELADASDAAIIVPSPNELIREYVEVMDRLKLIGSDVVGYIYNRAPMSSTLARYQRNGSSARPMDPRAGAHPALSASHPLDSGNGPLLKLPRE
jgi:Mrp family chromosome partitioning ATPase/capsular polysaccharide biosynthesis protein